MRSPKISRTRNALEAHNIVFRVRTIGTHISTNLQWNGSKGPEMPSKLFLIAFRLTKGSVQYYPFSDSKSFMCHFILFLLRHIGAFPFRCARGPYGPEMLYKTHPDNISAPLVGAKYKGWSPIKHGPLIWGPKWMAVIQSTFRYRRKHGLPHKIAETTSDLKCFRGPLLYEIGSRLSEMHHRVTHFIARPLTAILRQREDTCLET